MASNIDKALPHFLESDATLLSLVSTRIYPNKLPQGTLLPAITFQLVSTNRLQAHNEPSTLPHKRYQFTVYGARIDVIDPIVIALQQRMDGYRGIMGTGSFITIVDGVLLKDERKDDDPETGLVWQQQDYIIIVKE